MAILKPTGLTGRIVWLGLVADRAVSLRSEPVSEVEARFEGLTGECHSGLTRPSCSRVLAQYPERGTPIRNTRQVSILSQEELAAIAGEMGLERIRPEWVGANLVIAGIPDLTLLPPSGRLIFEGGASLTIDMENAPCQFPAREIERDHPGLGAKWIAAARGRRGLTAWVEREGVIRVGERLELHAPPARLHPALKGKI